jgi:NAD(P)-dependent dehydrogenase (short-subunit alcohol dehydrogenase family)
MPVTGEILEQLGDNTHRASWWLSSDLIETRTSSKAGIVLNSPRLNGCGALFIVTYTLTEEQSMSVVDFSLEGKVAIVTGGSRGIGRSIAIGLAEAGANVAIAARKPEALEEAVAAVNATGRRGIGIPTNVRELDSLQALVDQTKAEFGRVDILVNNAATNPIFGPVDNVDERAWDVVMNTNVKSAFFLAKAAREAMKEHGEGGSIINVSSVGGIRASAQLPIYSVSKAAIIMLTQVLATQWGEDNIRVNCIAPGLIKTDFSRALWDSGDAAGVESNDVALGRIGMPDEMAGGVVYLVSPAASFVTGQTLVLDGGGIL